MADPFTRDERDEIVSQMRDLWDRLYPAPPPPADVDPSDTPEPNSESLGIQSEMDALPDRERLRLRDEYYERLGSYFDRLPRMTLSACPYCAAPLRRAFDPWNIDGPWWAADTLCAFNEPPVCQHFRVLLGAIRLAEEEPPRSIFEVQPGPEVPFVVPYLLSLPGMIAVAGRTSLGEGGDAYPVAYFSNVPIEAKFLHQPWCRTTLWFEAEDGSESWTISNAEWDFDLLPRIEGGQLAWVDLESSGEPEVMRSSENCPLIELPGDRNPQQFIGGSRELLELPTGVPLNPFDE